MTDPTGIKVNLIDQLQVVQEAIVNKWNQSEAAGHGDPSCLQCLHLLLQSQNEIIDTLLRNFDVETDEPVEDGTPHH